MKTLKAKTPKTDDELKQIWDQIKIGAKIQAPNGDILTIKELVPTGNVYIKAVLEPYGKFYFYPNATGQFGFNFPEINLDFIGVGKWIE